LSSKIKIGRRFLAYRKKDISGVSGTGYVAEGIEFHDGQVVVSWFGKHHIFESPRDLKTWLKVHGHGGSTKIKWIDTKSQSSISTKPLRKPKNG
jgi:hypothetical protein